MGARSLGDQTRLLLLTRTWKKWLEYHRKSQRLELQYRACELMRLLNLRKFAFRQWKFLVEDAGRERVLAQQADVIGQRIAMRAALRVWRKKSKLWQSERRKCELMHQKHEINLHFIIFRVWRQLFQATRHHRRHVLRDSFTSLQEHHLELAAIEFHRSRLKASRARSYLSQWRQTVKWQLQLKQSGNVIASKHAIISCKQAFHTWRVKLDQWKCHQQLMALADQLYAQRLQRRYIGMF
jgi:hypothetical protein